MIYNLWPVFVDAWKYSFFPVAYLSVWNSFPFAFIDALSLPVLKAITYRLIMATHGHE